MEVSTHVSPAASWEMWRRDAAPALGPHVLGYVGYREWGSAGFRRLESPSGEVHVILSFGPRISCAGEELVSFVAAPDDEHAVVESAGEQHCVEIRLTPLGASLVLDLPLSELAHRVVPLEDVWPGSLVDRLYDLGTWERRFDLLDRVLAERIAAARPLRAEVEGAWWRLVATGGGVPVASLVEESGWSRRHFTARFTERAGLSPKTFARILRFDRAKQLLAAPAGPSLSEVALACGYYDQAHLNRDFRAFAGCTPVELMARRLPAGYSAGEVTSVQDGRRAAA